MEEASALLVVWPRSWKALLEKGVGKGVTVTVRVAVGEYRGKVQLLLEGPDDLRLEGAAPSPMEEPGETGGAPPPGDPLTREAIGKIVTVGGTVTEVARLRHGIRLRILRNGERVEVYVKNTVASRAEALSDLAAGGRLRVRGKVTEYRSRLQVTPLSAEDIVVESPGEKEPETLRTPRNRTAASLTRKDRGHFVILVGKVASLRDIDKGTLLRLDDGSGKPATIVVWDGVKKQLRDPAVLAEGKRIQVVGKVSLFQDELQVVPEEGWDLIEKK
jgi:DNA/RNA endonuclease YhcR with UshA esterase domain